MASTSSGQRIIDAISSQMASKYAAFRADHPGWRGRVSVLGHSLGSVLVLDLLTHAGTTYQGLNYPELPFAVDCFFAVGSPAALFLVARHGAGGAAGRGPATPGGSASIAACVRPRCRQMVNVVNAVDPISYLCAPLVLATEGGTVRATAPPPSAIPSSKSLPSNAAPHEIARFIRSHVATGSSAGASVHVVLLTRTRTRTLTLTLTQASAS